MNHLDHSTALNELEELKNEMLLCCLVVEMRAEIHGPTGPTAGAEDWPFRGERADSELASLARALGHPVRVHIFRLLIARGAVPYGDIAAAFPLAQSTVSEHLRVLRAAGLINLESEAARSIYKVDMRALRLLQVLIAGI